MFLKYTGMETNPFGVAVLLFLATVRPGFTRAQVATPKKSATFASCFLELRGPSSSFLSCFEVHAPLEPTSLCVCFLVEDGRDAHLHRRTQGFNDSLMCYAQRFVF